MDKKHQQNPFRPGAGHKPPYLAGRKGETNEFERLLDQDVILQNLVLTGLRGVGKTVLLDDWKPLAIKKDWLWVGTDLSESISLSEERIAIRLFTDLAVVTSGVVLSDSEAPRFGFNQAVQQEQITLTYQTLLNLYQATPGLVADKLKAVLEVVWVCLERDRVRGIVFAYDEAQNLADHAEKNEFPLSLLLDVFQSIQKKQIPFMLALVGLPTLFPKLVEARTFSERMFRVVFLDRLSQEDSRDAITKPVEETADCPVRIQPDSVETIVSESGGYPYFIQFICREVYDLSLQNLEMGVTKTLVPIQDITRKLDSDFFAGRWARVTDRQRELLVVIAKLSNSDGEFTVQEISQKSKELLSNPFSPSHISQMLATLSGAGLIYKNRHGKYSFAVPLLDRFIDRQEADVL